MEAMGRFFAMAIGTVGLFFLLFLNKTSSFLWQKNETVRSMSHAFAEHMMAEKEVSGEELGDFRETLEKLGSYRVTVSVFERRRYENESGRIYLFTESENPEEVVLVPGSYLRIVVTEEERSKLSVFLYGSPCTVYAGGRVV